MAGPFTSYRLRIYHAGKSRLAPLEDHMLTVGGAAEDDIRLDDPALPPMAFKLTLVEGGYTVHSVDDTCRPTVNGRQGEGLPLRPGDRLEAGPYVMILESGEEAPPEAGSAGGDEGLTRLCAWVTEDRELRPLLEKAMRLLLEEFRADEAFLFQLDGEGNPRVSVSTHPGRDRELFSSTVVREALRTRAGLCLGNALADPAFAGSASLSDLRLHSVLCCPILAAGRVSGLVYLGSKRPSVSFDLRQLRKLETYATVLGCLVNHVAYIAEQSRVIASLRDAGEAEGMVAACPAMKKALDEAMAVAASDICVLLQGETGTGKDVLAQHIHRKSRRSGGPFLVVNCSTLRGELLASELFGHRKGAFTGAVQDQKGLFLAADGGTLFLDEIGEMEPHLQAMLLRTLETGKVRPIGQAAEIQTDVRVICATNRDLKERTASGAFRADLYYRVNHHSIRLPPLRERGEDVQLLAYHYLEKAKARYPEKRVEGFHPDSPGAILRYAWPGNVRELANCVGKSVLLADGPLARISLPEEEGGWVDFETATRRFQSDYLLKALAFSGGDKEKAAAMLGMGRSTFFRHLSQAKGDPPPP